VYNLVSTSLLGLMKWTSKIEGRSGPTSLLGGTLKQWSRIAFRSVRKQIKDLERWLLFLRMEYMVASRNYVSSLCVKKSWLNSGLEWTG
jgi:hypothetical protein